MIGRGCEKFWRVYLHRVSMTIVTNWLGEACVAVLITASGYEHRSQYNGTEQRHH